MEPFAYTDVLSAEAFSSVLADSPLADRAERIRNTLREVHHQYLEQKLVGQRTGPEVDYNLLDEVAYYLSGVATTPDRSENISPSLRSQMLAVAGLIFEYLGDTASSLPKPSPELEESNLYYLDACICNSLGLFEANTAALAREYLLDPDTLVKGLSEPNQISVREVCRQLLYAWLARQIPLLWLRRRKIESFFETNRSKLRADLAENNVSRFTYNETEYWLDLSEAIVLHSRFFQFGKDSYITRANEKFSSSIEQAKRLNNPSLVWIGYSLQKCAKGMYANSIWKRLANVCPARYLRRLVTSSPPLLELWSSQVAAIEAVAVDLDTKSEIPLENGYLDPKVRRVVIGMPTSAGKTLLAELAIVRTLFPNVADLKPIPDVTCIYVVPNLALVNQIEEKLLARLLPLNVRVTAILGGYDTAQLDDGLLTQTRVAVVTPEKLDMLVRQDHQFIQRCGLFVFDEIHKVDNIGRGWTMEAIVTWLKDFHPQAKQAKMLFMSAVMPNYFQIQAWVAEQEPSRGDIPALSVAEPWQPTRQIRGFLEIDRNDLVRKAEIPPLIESWYGGHLNYVSDRNDLAHPRQIRRLIESKETFRIRKNRETGIPRPVRESGLSFGVVKNAAEVAKRYVTANFDPVLVFFMNRDETRSFCEYLASSENYSPENLGPREQNQYGLFISYLRERLGDGHPLATFAEKGMAYHHGFLPKDVRSEIEYAFAQGWIRVLASTTTLIEGVNFPISTFILADYERRLGKESSWRLEKKDFQNMIGRAGRAVYDTEGQIVFMVPLNPSPSGVHWQDYLFAQADDPERRILSSFCRADFRREIFEQILNALEDPQTAVAALRVDPENLEQYGPGAKDVGDTILRLQAFLLALMDKEVLDPENIDTIRKFFARTLFGQQQPDSKLLSTVVRFSQTTGRLFIKTQPDKQRLSIYGKIGLGFESCQVLYEKARDFWTNHRRDALDKNGQFASGFINDIGNFTLALPEVKPKAISIPHTRPTRYLDLPHGEILGQWVVSQSQLKDIREKYFAGIQDRGEQAEQCANYIRDCFEFKLPWVLSAFNLFVSDIAQKEAGGVVFSSTVLAQHLSMLPAYAKFGVNNPASAFFSMLGVSLRRVAILLGIQYNQANPADRFFDFARMLTWLLEVEPEQVEGWFKSAYGDDTAGDVPRLFRLLDSIRSQEQSLEDVLPLETFVAGWQYYDGPNTISQMDVGEVIILKPDPLNPWDPNAVSVFDNRGNKLGFVPRELSRAVYSHLVSDLPLGCRVTKIDPEAKYHPVKIELQAVEV